MNWLKNSWSNTCEFAHAQSVRFWKWFLNNWAAITWAIFGIVFIALFITGLVSAEAQASKQYTWIDGNNAPHTATYYHGHNTHVTVNGVDTYYGTDGRWFRDVQPTWGGLDKGWLALFICGIIFAILLLIGFAGWLRGSKWINKSNPYIKGKVYVRTRLQTVVFRITTLVIATVFLWSFFTDMFFGDISDISKSERPASLLSRIWDYGIEPWWYYQCFLSSFFLGWILLSKRYNWVKVIYPMAFIGAVRTFGDVSDWAEKGSWNIVDFHRGVLEHAMLIFAPLFIIIAQRDRYTLKNIKQTVIYTFLMVFVAYAMISINAMMNKDKEIKIDSWGEIEGVAHWWKLGGATETLQNAWLASHFHLFFWCMYVPFGIALVVLVIFNVNYWTYKSEAKGAWNKRWLQAFKDWWIDIKTNQWQEFTNSWTFFNATYRVEKRTKVAPFGVDPKVWEARKRK